MGKKVKIIMNQDVLNIGEEGDIRDVSAGFARNYLFPKKLAVLYTDHTLTILSQKKRKIEKRKEEKKILARDIKDRIEKEEILFTLQAGENGKLFGSITNGHIAEELQRRGFSLERKKIEVPDHHLKMVGEYAVKVKLYGDEEAMLKVVVKAQEIKVEQSSEKKEKAGRGERGKSRSKAKPEAEAAHAETPAADQASPPPAAEEENAAAPEETEGR
ncbi:MAG: 50S ribosomal protein L9 [Spirochaetales bacterium]|nr:50S ribosomal protein L9 [Spirochaetales bacterium]